MMLTYENISEILLSIINHENQRIPNRMQAGIRIAHRSQLSFKHISILIRISDLYVRYHNISPEKARGCENTFLKIMDRIRLEKSLLTPLECTMLNGVHKMCI